MAASCNHYFWIDVLKKEQRVKEKWERQHGVHNHDKPVHFHRVIKTPHVTTDKKGEMKVDHNKPHKETEVCVMIAKSKPNIPKNCEACKGAVTTFCYECCMCGCKRVKDVEHYQECIAQHKQLQKKGSSKSSTECCRRKKTPSEISDGKSKANKYSKKSKHQK